MSGNVPMFEDTSNYGYADYNQPQQPQQPQQQQQQQQPPMQQPTQPIQGQATPQMFTPGQQMFDNTQFQQMGMAMGQQFIGQHTDMLRSKAQEYIPTNRLRYLYAVDNSYVFNKLKVILLPWFQTEWHLKYQSDQNLPIMPR